MSRKRLQIWLCAASALLASEFTVLAQTPATPVSLEPAVASAAELRRIRSLVVSRNGEIVLERYFHGARATSLANVKSVSKSVISALTGIAIAKGLIPGLHAPIAPYFPELTAAVDARKRKITIEDLLTMRSGLESTSSRNYGAWVGSANWVRFALSRRLISEPGSEMRYSTGNTHLLSAILTKAAGRSTWALAQETLAKPLGFSLAQWSRDPQGIYFGGNQMLMTPRQMLQLGELYLNRGKLDGRQIVPAEWVDASVVPRTRSPISGQQYGYGWWISEMAGEPIYYAWGFGGQFIFVAPSLRLVVATTSLDTVGEERRGHRSAVWDLIERQVVEPVVAAERNRQTIAAGAQ
jgi:CubicO group peptidase (beta-lactamase class C family)